MTSNPSSLWHFACTVYESKQTLFLELQNHYHCNVNEVLYLLWLHNKQHTCDLNSLDTKPLKKIKRRIEAIRYIRQHSKWQPTLYQYLKKLELHKEKHHIQLLESIQTLSTSNASNLITSYLYQYKVTPTLIAELIGNT